MSFLPEKITNPIFSQIINIFPKTDEDCFLLNTGTLFTAAAAIFYPPAVIPVAIGALVAYSANVASPYRGPRALNARKIVPLPADSRIPRPRIQHSARVPPAAPPKKSARAPIAPTVSAAPTKPAAAPPAPQVPVPQKPSSDAAAAAALANLKTSQQQPSKPAPAPLAPPNLAIPAAASSLPPAAQAPLAQQPSSDAAAAAVLVNLKTSQQQPSKPAPAPLAPPASQWPASAPIVSAASAAPPFESIHNIQSTVPSALSKPPKSQTDLEDDGDVFDYLHLPEEPNSKAPKAALPPQQAPIASAPHPLASVLPTPSDLRPRSIDRSVFGHPLREIAVTPNPEIRKLQEILEEPYASWTQRQSTEILQLGEMGRYNLWMKERSQAKQKIEALAKPAEDAVFYKQWVAGVQNTPDSRCSYQAWRNALLSLPQGKTEDELRKQWFETVFQAGNPVDNRKKDSNLYITYADWLKTTTKKGLPSYDPVLYSEWYKNEHLKKKKPNGKPLTYSDYECWLFDRNKITIYLPLQKESLAASQSPRWCSRMPRELQRPPRPSQILPKPLPTPAAVTRAATKLRCAPSLPTPAAGAGSNASAPPPRPSQYLSELQAVGHDPHFDHKNGAPLLASEPLRVSADPLLRDTVENLTRDINSGRVTKENVAAWRLRCTNLKLSSFHPLRAHLQELEKLV